MAIDIILLDKQNFQMLLNRILRDILLRMTLILAPIQERLFEQS